MNVFKPQSYVSVLRRGAIQFGPYVGEFECVQWIVSRMLKLKGAADMGRTSV